MALRDSEGNTLCRFNPRNPLRQQPVWAVYRVEAGSAQIEERCSEFVVWTRAKEIADELNTERSSRDQHFFSVFRRSRAANGIDSGVEEAAGAGGEKLE